MRPLPAQAALRQVNWWSRVWRDDLVERAAKILHSAGYRDLISLVETQLLGALGEGGGAGESGDPEEEGVHIR